MPNQQRMRDDTRRRPTPPDGVAGGSDNATQTIDTDTDTPRHHSTTPPKPCPPTYTPPRHHTHVHFLQLLRDLCLRQDCDL